MVRWEEEVARWEEEEVRREEEVVRWEEAANGCGRCAWRGAGCGGR